MHKNRIKHFLKNGLVNTNIILVPGSAWNPKHMRLLPRQCSQLTSNEAEPLSIGIPGRAWNGGTILTRRTSS